MENLLAEICDFLLPWKFLPQESREAVIYGINVMQIAF